MLFLGPHCILVSVGELEILGSPFACQVYDVTKIRVKHLPSGVVGKPFDMDSKLC